MLHDPATAAKFYVKRDYKAKSVEEDRLWQKVLQENAREVSTSSSDTSVGVEPEEEEEELEHTESVFGTTTTTITSPSALKNTVRAVMIGQGRTTSNGDIFEGDTIPMLNIQRSPPPFPSNETVAYTPTQANYIPRQGDWSCAECGNVNFAFRTECRRCHVTKPLGLGLLCTHRSIAIDHNCHIQATIDRFCKIWPR